MSAPKSDPEKNAILVMLDAMMSQERRFDRVAAELDQTKTELARIKAGIAQLAEQCADQKEPA
jgi:hypothetical protein